MELSRQAFPNKYGVVGMTYTQANREATRAYLAYLQKKTGVDPNADRSAGQE